MSPFCIANAPCSWGTLEFEGLSSERIEYTQMLDELVATGYTGTELGDWGFMPTTPTALAAELQQRQLTLIGAYVPVPLAGTEATSSSAICNAQRTAELLAHTAQILRQSHQPLLILADENGSDAYRTANAGRITTPTSTTVMHQAAKMANHVARVVHTSSGLQTAFHHHCAGLIETSDEVRRFMQDTDPAVLGLVFDTGHYLFGSGHNTINLVDAITELASRIRLVHFKDCSAQVADQTRRDNLDYFAALKSGIFCELGKGTVPFADVLATLKALGYDGWIVVEQDVLPGMGAPRESATRNREFLRSLGV
ncbi:MAG: TIM barrel protein [Roseiflexaceae bacterium]